MYLLLLLLCAVGNLLFDGRSFSHVRVYTFRHKVCFAGARVCYMCIHARIFPMPSRVFRRPSLAHAWKSYSFLYKPKLVSLIVLYMLYYDDKPFADVTGEQPKTAGRPVTVRAVPRAEQLPLLIITYIHIYTRARLSSYTVCFRVVT